MYRDLSCPVDLLVYTPEELARNRERGFIRRVLEEGRRWLRQAEEDFAGITT
jgi:hypothetical protein